MPVEIKHDPEHHRFFTEVDGHLAYSHYRMRPGVITFVHTEVPAEFGGHGIGSAIARAGLDFARAEGLKVVAECPFVAAFIRDHPEYRDLLAI
jgi:uncharacterized protein